MIFSFWTSIKFILLLLSLQKVTPIEDRVKGDLHSSKPSNSNCDGPDWVWWSAGVWVVPPALPVLFASRSWFNPWPQVCVSQRTGDILKGRLALFSFRCSHLPWRLCYVKIQLVIFPFAHSSVRDQQHLWQMGARLGGLIKSVLWNEIIKIQK